MPISFVEYYQIMKRENPSLKLQGNVRTIMSNVLLFNAQKLFFSFFRGVTRTQKRRVSHIHNLKIRRCCCSDFYHQVIKIT